MIADQELVKVLARGEVWLRDNLKKIFADYAGSLLESARDALQHRATRELQAHLFRELDARGMDAAIRALDGVRVHVEIEENGGSVRASVSYSEELQSHIRHLADYFNAELKATGSPLARDLREMAYEMSSQRFARLPPKHQRLIDLAADELDRLAQLDVKTSRGAV